MIISRSIENIEKSEHAITIGNFDGLHTGHIEILNKLKAVSKNTGLSPLVITIWPHPDRYFNRNGSKLILTLSERIRAILNTGLEDILILNIRDIADCELKDFIDDILITRLNMKHLVVGSGQAMGRGGVLIEGRIEGLADSLGFTYEIVGEIVHAGRRVSSTLIRELIREGDITTANSLMAQRYSLCGSVVRGRGVGSRVVGIPTLNIRPAGYKIVPRGVFATIANTGDEIHPSVTNCGPKPTLGDDTATIETHIIGWEGGAPNRVRVEFVDRIREQKRFKDVDMLRHQILEDIEKAKAILSE